MSSKVAIIIPARMDSTRFPGKPLARINGECLLHLTYRRASCVAHTVIVATPDAAISDYCKEKGLACTLTDTQAPNGTWRCAQVIRDNEELADVTTVVNWQVDEPLVPAAAVRGLLQLKVPIGTLVANCSNSYYDNNTVKVITNDARTVCHWFTRLYLSYARFHCGIYAFDRKTLLELQTLPATTSSKLESLEQLTWLEYGKTIVPYSIPELPLSVNTAEDLKAVERKTAW